MLEGRRRAPETVGANVETECRRFEFEPTVAHGLDLRFDCGYSRIGRDVGLMLNPALQLSHTFTDQTSLLATVAMHVMLVVTMSWCKGRLDWREFKKLF